MKQIESREDLKKERIRLNYHLRSVEKLLKNDINNIRDTIEPVHVLLKGMNSILLRKDNSLLNGPINFSIDLLVKGLLLRNSGFVAKLILPFIAKNMANNYIADNKNDIGSWLLQKIKSLLSNHQGNHKSNNKIEETAAI